MNQTTESSEQAWQEARALLAKGKTAESVIFLERATQAQHPAASYHLGCLHLFELIEAADKQRAGQLIQQAADAHHGPAYYQLAMMALGTPDKIPDWQHANTCLHKSATLKYPVALRALALHWSRSHDHALLQLSTLCLEHAAQAGDMLSLALLMHRLYQGHGCEKNILRASAINTLLMQSNIEVEPAISPTHPHFAQPLHLPDLPELPIPTLQEDDFEQPVEIISESPWVCVSDNLLNEEECHLLRYLGAPYLKPSITADPDGKLVQVQLRSSFDMVLNEFLEDISLLMAQRRMAALMGTTPAYSEPLHLLRYQNGQEYKPHRDYLPPSLILPLEQGGPGQRESTAIVYLNTMKSGGETEFLEINKKIAPKMGRVLGFKNLLPDGSPDTRTLHAGLPVKFGTKWIATLWIHQGVFRK